MEPADRTRRLRAHLLDRALGWGTAVAAGLTTGVAGFLLALAAATLATAVLAGRATVTPGLAAFGLRVVRRSDGHPVGVLPALLRAVVLGAAGVPTLGLGVAILAWTALSDPAGERRGLHDRLAGTIVVPRRAAPSPVAEPAAPTLVNLTALRLLPDPEPLVPDLRVPSAPARVPAPCGSWRVVLDTGEVLPVAARARLGSARLQATPDGALVVMEGSADGVVVVRRGHARTLAPGRPSTLLDGDLLRLGALAARVEHRR